MLKSDLIKNEFETIEVVTIDLSDSKHKEKIAKILENIGFHETFKNLYKLNIDLTKFNFIDQINNWLQCKKTLVKILHIGDRDHSDRNLKHYDHFTYNMTEYVVDTETE